MTWHVHVVNISALESQLNGCSDSGWTVKQILVVSDSVYIVCSKETAVA